MSERVRQLDLSFDAREAPRTDRVAAAEGLADEVAARLGAPVRLVVHDNRHTMVSFRRERARIQLRVHHLPQAVTRIGHRADQSRPCGRPQQTIADHNRP